MKENIGGAAARRTGRGVEILARMGYAAKGVVYFGVGTLTAAAAFGSGSGDASGSREALSEIAQGAWGTVVLAVVALGITGYVVWRLVQTFEDPDGLGNDLKGVAVRGVCFASAVIYAGLGFWVVRVLLDGGAAVSGGQDSGGGASTWSAALLQQPYGAWLLGILGLAVIGVAVAEWVRAYRASFEKRLRPELSGTARSVVRKVARVGLMSRGVVFLIIGGFLIHAAVTADPSEAQGLEQALETLGRQPYGPWLMGVVALGLAAYGVLQWVKAWYRRIGPIRSSGRYRFTEGPFSNGRPGRPDRMPTGSVRSSGDLPG